MEEIRIRLADELRRAGKTGAQAARDMGLPDSQGLRDVLAGKKRLSAELLAAMTLHCGVDPLYVLTGQRGQAATEHDVLPPRERALVENYRAADDSGKRVIEGTADLAAQPSRGAARRGR